MGTKGDYYVVGTAGSTNLNGISNWGVGDLATFNGSVWQRVEGGADLNGVNLSVSGTSTLSGLTASTALALNASKEIVSVTNTGTGNNVLATTPTLVGDVTLSTGNLVIGTAGKGIDFSINPAAAGMTSELLDDYETGTWTPTYTPASGAFGAITYNSNTFGRYTKIGNAVFIVGLIITDSFAVGTGSGQGRISGLPFTPSPSASASINYSVNFNTDHPTGSFTSGADIFLTQRATANGASAAFNSGSFTTGASAFANYVYFQMNYVV